jgi:hypothetical protein
MELAENTRGVRDSIQTSGYKGEANRAPHGQKGYDSVLVRWCAFLWLVPDP